jgi:hypothetical protein
VDDQLSAVDGVPQLAGHRQARDGRVVHLRREHGVAPLAGCLGLVEREVRVAHQVLGRLALVADDDADAGAGRHLGAVDVHGLGQHLDEAPGDLLAVRRRLDVLEQDGELVATQPGSGVALAQHGADALGRLAQQRVAGRVPERVVDGLEVVEVEEQHAVAAGAPGARHGVAEPVAEEGPVGQAGEGVVEGLMGQLLLELVAVGDVVAGDDEPGQVLVDDLGDDGVEQPDAAVLGHQPQLAADRAPAAGQADELARGVAVLLGDDVEPVEAEQLGRGLAEQRLDCGRHVHDGQVVVEDADHVGGVLQHQPQPALAAALDEDLADVEPLQREGHGRGQRLQGGERLGRQRRRYGDERGLAGRAAGRQPDDDEVLAGRDGERRVQQRRAGDDHDATGAVGDDPELALVEEG